jgi:hypothetical protein
MQKESGSRKRAQGGVSGNALVTTSVDDNGGSSGDDHTTTDGSGDPTPQRAASEIAGDASPGEPLTIGSTKAIESAGSVQEHWLNSKTFFLLFLTVDKSVEFELRMDLNKSCRQADKDEGCLEVASVMVTKLLFKSTTTQSHLHLLSLDLIVDAFVACATHIQINYDKIQSLTISAAELDYSGELIKFRYDSTVPPNQLLPRKFLYPCIGLTIVTVLIHLSFPTNSTLCRFPRHLQASCDSEGYEKATRGLWIRVRCGRFCGQIPRQGPFEARSKDC